MKKLLLMCLALLICFSFFQKKQKFFELYKEKGWFFLNYKSFFLIEDVHK